jgi:hypothetical protein
MESLVKVIWVSNIIVAVVFWAAKKQDKANWHLLIAILIIVVS